MGFQREQWWWLGACAAGLGLTALAGGIVGPEIALFAIVALAGWLLIRYEGPAPAIAPELPVERFDEALDYPEEPAAREEPAAAEPVADEPAAAEPVADEPAAEEQAPEEQVAEEQVAEEQVAEEQVAEEQVPEEPVAEESAPGEPVTDGDEMEASTTGEDAEPAAASG